jgi:hypothetical protein
MKTSKQMTEAIRDAITSLEWAALALDIPADRECTFNDSIAALREILNSEVSR